ncbi:MAG: ParB/RepB/Spo0J family partition protein [Candidatus Hodarchaeales archaeon]
MPTTLNVTKEYRILNVDPRAIREEKGFNVRSKYDKDEIETLMKDIIKNGLKKPLHGKRVAKDDFIITDGHRRRRAILMAIEKGHDIKYVKFIPEAKGYSEENRILDLVTMNSGKPLNPVEEAEVFTRLNKFGWSQEVIAEHIGMTQAHVSGRMKIQDFSRYVKDLLIDKIITVSLAETVVDNYPTIEDQKKTLQAAIKKMKEVGRKKVMGKDVKKPRRKPVSAPQTQDRVGKYHKLFEDTIVIMKEKKWTKKKIDKVSAIMKLLDSKDSQAMYRGFSKMAL